MKKYKKELILEIISLIILLPVLFVVMVGSGTCNFRIWTMIIFIIPIMLTMMLENIIPIPSGLLTNLEFATAPVLLPIILNTIALRGLRKKTTESTDKNTKEYKICKIINIINYAISIAYIIKSLLANQCTGF